jgi:hypothetical protein
MSLLKKSLVGLALISAIGAPVAASAQAETPMAGLTIQQIIAIIAGLTAVGLIISELDSSDSP